MHQDKSKILYGNKFVINNIGIQKVTICDADYLVLSIKNLAIYSITKISNCRYKFIFVLQLVLHSVNTRDLLENSTHCISK